MVDQWTPQKVLELAPDGSSASAGQSLAKPAKWQSLGRSPRALWGEFQGSGKDPYRVRIDLAGPAFKCSCPSRKFPCKHGVGLLLIHAQQPESLKSATEPDWVESWLKDRAAAAESKAARVQEQESKPPDPQLQAKRQAARESKIQGGLDELSLWLEDLVRQGLAAAPGQPANYWETMVARLVDAQAPGLARLVRRLGQLSGSGEGWQERLLAEAGRLHLAVRAYRSLDTLPEPTQADVRSLVGWTVDQDELLRQGGAADQWIALGQVTETDERLRVQRTWLWGLGTQRPALVLHFDAGPQSRGSELVAGARFGGELAYFPGAVPLRALIKTRDGQLKNTATRPAGAADIGAARTVYAAALAQNPWVERWPMTLEAVKVERSEQGGSERWSVRDGTGAVLPLAPGLDLGWHWLALSGGQPLGLFGEWDGWTLTPLAAWTDRELYVVSRGLERTSVFRAA